jgi:hypothetical protein
MKECDKADTCLNAGFRCFKCTKSPDYVPLQNEYVFIEKAKVKKP